jgi:hypothetical protein
MMKLSTRSHVMFMDYCALCTKGADCSWCEVEVEITGRPTGFRTIGSAANTHEEEADSK